VRRDSCLASLALGNILHGRRRNSSLGPNHTGAAVAPAAGHSISFCHFIDGDCLGHHPLVLNAQIERGAAAGTRCQACSLDFVDLGRAFFTQPIAHSCPNSFQASAVPAPRAAAVAFKGAPGEFAKRELPAFTKRSRETTCGIIPQMLRNISAFSRPARAVSVEPLFCNC
jgi:hypothetical protein